LELREEWNTVGYVLAVENEVITSKSGMQSSKLADLKCFVKSEFYDKYKNPRGIFARGDLAKCVFGPFVKQCEKVLFAEPFFVKGIPVNEWAGLMVERLMVDGATYEEGDYSSMESSFIVALLDALDCAFYKHMASTNSHFHDIARMFCNMLRGNNVCNFGNLTVEMKGRKMSGEMNTSQSNAFATLMLAQFFHFKRGGGFMSLPMLVEGDDSLASKILALVSDPKEYAKLGFTYEALLSDNIGKLGFCGVKCVPTIQQNTTDPLKVLLNVGWLDAKYSGARWGKTMSLLKMKFLSWGHCYPSCPIVFELCRSGLQILKHIDVRAVKSASGWWETQKQSTWDPKGPAFVEPAMATRLLMEEENGVTVGEQLELERYFREEYDPSRPIDHIVLTNILDKQRPHLREVAESFVTDNLEAYERPLRRSSALRTVAKFLLTQGNKLVKSRVNRNRHQFGLSAECLAHKYVR